MPFINDMLAANEKESIIQSLPAQGMERFRFTFDPDAVIQSIKKNILGQDEVLEQLQEFVFFNALFYVYYDSADIRMAALWLLWAMLWFLFFCAFSLNKTFKHIGALTLLIGIFTCTIPGLMMVTHHW